MTNLHMNKIPELVILARERVEGTRVPWVTEGLNASTTYAVYGMREVVFESEHGEPPSSVVCYLLRGEDGKLRDYAISNFEVVTT